MEPEPIFFETAAAAKSHKNGWTRMASTYQCIDVCLTQDTLTIRPRGLMGLIIKGLGFDLHHTIPCHHIEEVKEEGKWFDYGRVEVIFNSLDKRQKLTLYLKKATKFIEIIQSKI